MLNPLSDIYAFNLELTERKGLNSPNIEQQKFQNMTNSPYSEHDGTAPSVRSSTPNSSIKKNFENYRTVRTPTVFLSHM